MKCSFPSQIVNIWAQNTPVRICSASVYVGGIETGRGKACGGRLGTFLYTSITHVRRSAFPTIEDQSGSNYTGQSSQCMTPHKNHHPRSVQLRQPTSPFHPIDQNLRRSRILQHNARSKHAISRSRIAKCDGARFFPRT